MSKESDTSRTQIIVGALGFLGVLVTVLATVFAPIIQERFKPNAPTQTPIVIVASPTLAPIIPTDTVPPGADTSTPAPTDTPVPPTFTAIPPVPIGQDWTQGCISSLWKPYSSAGPVDALEKDGCLSQPVNVFFANGGRLSFLYEHRLSSAEVQGLFAPMPASSGSASVKVNMRDLNTSDIWIGFFAGPSVDAQGLLLTLPSGKVSERPFVAWQMPGLDKITTTQPLSQGSGYGVRFEFNAGSVRAVILPNVFATNTYPISSAEKWLFIGFQAKNGNNRIDATFFDLVIGN